MNSQHQADDLPYKVVAIIVLTKASFCMAKMTLNLEMAKLLYPVKIFMLPYHRKLKENGMEYPNVAVHHGLFQWK